MAREYPHDIKAERSLLGAMLISKEAVNEVINIATVNDFYVDRHKIIYEAMIAVFKQRIPIDVTTVTSQLTSTNQIDKAGGVEYLLELSQSVPTVSHTTFYLKILSDKALLRRLISQANDICDKAYGEVDDMNDFISNVEKDFLDVTRDRNAGEFKSANEVVKEVTDHLNVLQKAGGSVTGVKSGYTDLDRITSGFQNGDLIIIAARPSVGKTAFALNIALNASTDSKEPVAIFSLEMPASQLIQRIICSKGEIESNKLRNGSILKTKESSTKYYAAANEITKCNLYIDDTPSIKVGEIAAKCRRLKQEHGLKLIIIDYLQLISGPSNSRESRQQEVSDISRQLKGIARELKVPVIALSQLSRSVEKRDNKRPVLSDLRESGAIEQDADIVSFIHRDDYQKPEKEEETNGVTDIIIAKHRNGATGDVKLMFTKQYSKFSNMYISDDNGVRL